MITHNTQQNGRQQGTTATMSDTATFESLIAVGFSEHKARQIWAQWTNWPSGPPSREIDPFEGGLQMTFYDFFISSLEIDDGDTWSENDDEWRESLDNYGINRDTQNKIMDPNFRYLRLSRSARYWAKDTVEMRYTWLQRTAEASAAAADPVSTQSCKNSGTTAEVSSQQRVHFPGHVTLFMATNLGRARRFFDGQLNSNNDSPHGGQFNLKALGDLRCPAPSDFHGHSSVYYFSPIYEIARIQASYAKRRASDAKISILSVTIPYEKIKKLEGYEILRTHWPSPVWKELVWRSRRGQILSGDLRSYRGATLMIGTMAQKPDAVYQALNSGEDVTGDCVYLMEGSGFGGPRTPAVQYMFSAVEGEEFLRDHGIFRIVQSL